MRKFVLFGLGLGLVLIGCLLAAFIQSADGVKIRDIRFAGSKGAVMSALLYIPPNATAQTPAPGILAIHGYMNSRETQDGFAIEFARRGYVVLALDQTGHGYSSAPAFANGFGGPDGLRYLRSLAIVDKNNIGLEGHSMGGWAAVSAAAAIPDGYKALVLEGSSTGRPLAPEGTATFPRNLELVFSQFDEFSQTMWRAPGGKAIVKSPKLMAVFGTKEPVQIGQLYGDIAAGTGRILFSPPITHAWDHFSTEAIGHSLSWFQRTLKGGVARPPSDQIWYWKEIGTLIALIGFVVLLLGSFELLLALPFFERLAAEPAPAREQRGAGWWGALALTIAIPALSYLPICIPAAKWLPASPLLPQSFTNQIVIWAAFNALITLVLALAFRSQTKFNQPILSAVLISILTVAIGYGALLLADLVFKVDFRFWIVGLKTLSPERLQPALLYLVPFTIYFVVALHALHQNLAIKGESAFSAYATNILALVGGFALIHAAQYGTLFATDHLLSADQGLLVIIGLQFLPLMTIVAIITTFTYRRTNSALPGALIAALFVTWYIVAGQAVQAA